MKCICIFAARQYACTCTIGKRSEKQQADMMRAQAAQRPERTGA